MIVLFIISVFILKFNYFEYGLHNFFWHIAQMVEHTPYKREVMSSILIMPITTLPLRKKYNEKEVNKYSCYN